MPDMANVKDSLFEYNLMIEIDDSAQHKSRIERSLGGGRCLDCYHCGAKKSYSGSSQKLIAEAFHDSGWLMQLGEGNRWGACCPECVAKEPEIGYAKLLAEMFEPTKEEKPKYDYGCNIVHPYPGSMALTPALKSESPITFSGVDPFTYEAIYIHANGYERRLAQPTLDGKWYIYPKNKEGKQ